MIIIISVSDTTLHNIAPLNLHLYRCPPLERDLQIMQVPFAVKTAGSACQHNRVGVFFYGENAILQLVEQAAVRPAVKQSI